MTPDAENDGPSGPDGARLISIQVLRVLAALAVVAYHALQRVDDSFDVGRSGVDVFFVISGFVLWRATRGRDIPPASFLWARVTRIVPLYWLVTGSVLAAVLAWPAFLPVVRPGWSHLALSLAFIPHLDPRGLPFPTLPPGWSLDYEAVFYLVLAAALAGPREWRARVVFGGLTFIAVLGVLIPPLYFLGANFMLLQFAAGAGLAVAFERGWAPSRPIAAGMTALALAVWIGVGATGLFTELWRPLLWGIPAALTVAGAVGLESRGVFRRLPAALVHAITLLGDASYALYLLHLPATAIVAWLFGWTPGWVFLAIAMGVSVLAGLAGRAWIEKPLLEILRRRHPPALHRRAPLSGPRV